VLDLSADDNPAQVAALEQVFVLAGLLLIEGVELPADQLEALWDEQLGLTIDLPNGVVRRRIEYATEESSLLLSGTWLLAALSIAEHLPSGRGFRHGLLRPWPSGAPVAGLRNVYDTIAEALAGPDTPWSAKAMAMLDRLRQAVGSLQRLDGRAHALELPGLILDEIEQGVVNLAAWNELVDHELSLRAVGWLAAARGIAWARIADAILGSWQAAGYPRDLALPLFDGKGWSAKVWSHASASWLAEFLPSASPQERRVVFEFMTSEHWLALEDTLRLDGLREDANAWSNMPDELLKRMLAEMVGTTSDAIARLLWQRHAALVLSAFETQVRSAELPAARLLLECAPREQTGALVRCLREHIDPARTETALLNPLREWLHHRVAERAKDWQSAYEFLSAIEQALSPVRRSLELGSELPRSNST
jgi:hypothetical protein